MKGSKESTEPPKPRGLIIAIGVLAVSLAANILLRINKDGFVIQFGIHLFQTVSNVLVFAAILIGVACLVLAVLYVRKWLVFHKAQKPVEEPKREPEAVLSVSKEMDSRKLYDILTAYASRSQVASEELLRCAMQLKTMDIYQAKLANLLSNNGAKNLSDTQDVLDQVEQYLCKAVRKVINYIDVADEHSEKDAKVILEKLETCYKDCQAQLDQVKEFLFIMAEFLNKQGSDDTTPETLDVYKQCILKSIHEEI